MSQSKTLELSQENMDHFLRIIPDKNEISSQDASLFLQNNFGEHQKPFKIVYPTPGACIKTWFENGEKLFINICHSKDIKPPEDISDQELNKILVNETPSFIIPLAIGVERLSTDKKNYEKPTFDVLINSQYFEKCKEKDLFWKFTVQVIMESISEKYSKSINTEKFVELKNKKAMGTLQPFRIEDRPIRKPEIKKPMIEVLKIEKGLDFKEINKNINTRNKNEQQYVILKTLQNNKILISYIHILANNLGDIKIDVTKNRVLVENEKNEFLLDFFLPNVIDEGRVTAKYDSKLQILQLILPLKKD